MIVPPAPKLLVIHHDVLGLDQNKFNKAERKKKKKEMKLKHHTKFLIRNEHCIVLRQGLFCVLIL